MLLGEKTRGGGLEEEIRSGFDSDRWSADSFHSVVIGIKIEYRKVASGASWHLLELLGPAGLALGSLELLRGVWGPFYFWDTLAPLEAQSPQNEALSERCAETSFSAGFSTSWRRSCKGVLSVAPAWLPEMRPRRQFSLSFGAFLAETRSGPVLLDTRRSSSQETASRHASQKVLFAFIWSIPGPNLARGRVA